MRQVQPAAPMVPTVLWSGVLLLCLVVLSPAGIAAQSAAQASAGDVDDLLARGRVQEAAWAARAAGDTARADELLARLDSILRSQPARAAPLSMDSQGVSYSFRLNYGDGVEAIFKVDGSDIFCPNCGADREAAVYRIDRLLGADLTPMTVLTSVVVDEDTLQGSAMYFVHEAQRAGEIEAEKPDRLRFFDAIIGNSDRHDGNWLVGEDGFIAAIDHNRAFEYRPSTNPKSCWEWEIDRLQEPGRLGAVLDRYRALPTDSLAAAVEGLDPALAQRFVEMRGRVVARVDQRAERPRRELPRVDCPPPE